MKVKISTLSLLILMSATIKLSFANQPTIVENTLASQEVCRGKLVLKPLQIWGGDDEEDLEKVIKQIGDIKFDKERNMYICATYQHCVKVISPNGDFIRRIGRSGKGPGDLLTPCSLDFALNGDLVVLESVGRRVQRFNSAGKSVSVFKIKDLSSWMGITSKDEIMLYFPFRTFRSRKILYLMDADGNEKKGFGDFHDAAENEMLCEKFLIAMDHEDNVYVVHRHAPVIRKYSSEGKLLLVIAFEVPFQIPEVRIETITEGDGIKVMNEGENPKAYKRNSGSNGGILHSQKIKSKNEWKTICIDMAIDSSGHLYLLTRNRLLKDEEKEKLTVRFEGSGIVSDTKGNPDIDLSDTIDLSRILVIAPNGKVIAEAPIIGDRGGIYINEDKLFLKGGSRYQKLHSFKVTLKN